MAKPAAKAAPAEDDDLFSDPKDKANKSAAVPSPISKATVARSPSPESMAPENASVQSKLEVAANDGVSEKSAFASSAATESGPSDSAPRKPAEAISPPQPEAAASDAVTGKGLRLWTDNTGKFQIRARLFAVLDGEVRLLKETGRFTTVPFERLSAVDLQFVQQSSQVTAASAPARPAAPL